MGSKAQMTKTADRIAARILAAITKAVAEGWLDPKRKRPLPRPPEAIGLITGETSRAYRDVTGSLHDAGIQAHVTPQFVLLSGPDVATQTRAAISSLNDRPEIDLIVIARGGTNHRPDIAAFSDWDRAQAIVDYRNTHGAFKSADELASVKGVGEKIVERNRENILVSSKEQ